MLKQNTHPTEEKVEDVSKQDDQDQTFAFKIAFIHNSELK